MCAIIRVLSGSSCKMPCEYLNGSLEVIISNEEPRVALCSPDRSSSKILSDTLRVRDLMNGNSRVVGNACPTISGVCALTAEVARMPHTYTNRDATEYRYMLS